jgi:2-oxoglutarate dehydrogenase complex dehydrogenase (E1) component-like enzyme
MSRSAALRSCASVGCSRKREEAKPVETPLLFVGRPWRAATAEGYPTAHLREQDRIVRAALTAV